MRKSLLLLCWLSSLSLCYAEFSWGPLNLVNGCRIFDSKGIAVKTLPGEFCQFYTNGDLLTATVESLKMIDQNNHVKWELKGAFHHQLNKSLDEKRILVLDSFIKRSKHNPNIIVEKFMVLDLVGKILFQATSEDLLSQVSVKMYAPNQQTHLNSFYEIPKLTTNRVLPSFLKEGNFILNSYRSGVFILSPDLKKVLHHFVFKSSIANQVHDVQVLESGNILFFNNMSVDSKRGNPFSAIEELDMVTNEIVLSFSGNPTGIFYSLFCGGVQELDPEHILFSHVLTGTYIYSKRTKQIITNIHETHFKDGLFSPSQQVKMMDLRSFLSHWK